MAGPLGIHFYLNFTLRKKERRKKRPFEVEQCVQPIRNNSEFCARPGQKKTMAHPSHRFEESR
jgi:hypothetical protein